MESSFSTDTYSNSQFSRGIYLDIATLSNHLWESANILRGPVDAADFKTYIFPMLFFKRISDVYDEEYQIAKKEAGGDEEYAHYREHYRFQIPDNCHWQDVRRHTQNVGQALLSAMRGIEQANPDTLHGIFGDAQWTVSNSSTVSSPTRRSRYKSGAPRYGKAIPMAVISPECRWPKMAIMPGCNT